MAMLTWPTPLVQSREVGDGRSLLKTRGPIACGGACRPRAWETDATARCTAKRAESEGDVPLPNAFATFVTDHPPVFLYAPSTPHPIALCLYTTCRLLLRPHRFLPRAPAHAASSG